MPQKMGSAQTIVYPESDGKPMAETDVHRDLMVDSIQMLQHHFRDEPVYVSGNLLIYYEEGNIRKSVSPDVFVVTRRWEKTKTHLLDLGRGETAGFCAGVVKSQHLSE